METLHWIIGGAMNSHLSLAIRRDVMEIPREVVKADANKQPLASREINIFNHRQLKCRNDAHKLQRCISQIALAHGAAFRQADRK